MQDTYTGQMRELPPKFLKGIPLAVNSIPGMPPLLVDSKEARDKIQQACDSVQPDRSKQGPVFFVGETLEIRGGKFLITKIEPGYLKLKSLPRK